MIQDDDQCIDVRHYRPAILRAVRIAVERETVPRYSDFGWAHDPPDDVVGRECVKLYYATALYFGVKLRHGKVVESFEDEYLAFELNWFESQPRCWKEVYAFCSAASLNKVYP